MSSALYRKSSKLSFMGSRLSDRIRLIMRENNLKAVDLAKIAGVTSMAVSHWLNGPTETIQGSHAIKISHKLGYNSEWLMTGRGERFSGNQDRPGGLDLDKLTEAIVGAGLAIESVGLQWSREEIARWAAVMFSIYEKTGVMPNFLHAAQIEVLREP